MPAVEDGVGAIEVERGAGHAVVERGGDSDGAPEAEEESVEDGAAAGEEDFANDVAALGAEGEADSHFARALIDGEGDGAVNSAGGEDRGDDAEQEDEGDDIPENFGHLIDPGLEDAGGDEHSGIVFAEGGADGVGAGARVAVEADGHDVVAGGGRGGCGEGRFSGGRRSGCFDILATPTTAEGDTGDGDGLADGVFARPEGAGEAAGHDDGVAVRFWNSRPRTMGRPRVSKKAGGGVDVDGLDGVGVREDGVQGGAFDHRQGIGEGDGVNAGEGFDAEGDGVEPGVGGGDGGGFREAERGDDDLGGEVAGVGVEGAVFGLAEESRADEEDHAEGDLDGDEPAADPIAAGRAGVAFDGAGEIDVDRFEGGSEPGENAAEENDGGEEGEDQPVRRHGEFGGRGRDSGRAGAGCAARDRDWRFRRGGEDEALGDEHADEADLGRQARADGDFPCGGRRRGRAGGWRRWRRR